MTFQSLAYWLFLPLACGVVAGLSRPRARQATILVLSYMFYSSWSPWFPLLLFGSTAVNYGWGEAIRRRPSPRMLWGGIASNVLLLGFFKFGVSLGGLEWIVMPIGLSFFTFQGMSHLIDTYRDAEIRPTPIEFAVYMAFWPTVLSGPITRVREIVPQMRGLGRPTWDDMAVGCRRIATGLFMKMIVADTLGKGIQIGEGVTFGFDRLNSGWGGLDAWFLAVGFGFQLYFDFAGYSNVAIGSARLLGVKVRENFDHPYLADSPAVFWSRWHMSLTQWIRDYLFFPIAATLSTTAGRYVAVIMSMVVFGIWHGVGWTFVCWGLYDGVVLVVHRALQPWLPRRIASPLLGMAWRFAAWASTFLLVSWGWLLFRSASLAQAWALARATLDLNGYGSFSLRPNFYILVALVALLYFGHGWSRQTVARMTGTPAVSRVVDVLRPVYYALVVFAVIVWSHQSSVFVYFQF